MKIIEVKVLIMVKVLESELDRLHDQHFDRDLY
jgi:hypothetical protein